jgi:hypothetical protein
VAVISLGAMRPRRGGVARFGFGFGVFGLVGRDI